MVPGFTAQYSLHDNRDVPPVGRGTDESFVYDNSYVVVPAVGRGCASFCTRVWTNCLAANYESGSYPGSPGYALCDWRWNACFDSCYMSELNNPQLQ